MSYRKPILLVVVAALVAAGVWLATRDGSSRTAEPPAAPAAGEPQVLRHLGALRAAVLEDPESAPRWGRLGMAFDAHDLLPQAVRCYAEAARLAPDDHRWPALQARCLPEAGPDVLIDLLSEARRRQPSDHTLALKLGFELLDAGRAEAARSHFQDALQREPRSSHAHLGLARVALASGDDERARELLLKAAGLAPRHREVHALLARVHRALGDEERARAAAVRAAALPPGRTPIPDPLAALVAREGVGADQLRRRARAFARAGRPDQAVQLLELALQARPGDPDLLVALADVHGRAGRAEEGLALVARALDERPGHGDARRAEASLLAAAGRTDEAVERYRKLLAGSPDDVAARYGLGVLLARHGRFGAALETLTPGLAHEPPHYGLMSMVAWLLSTVPDDDLRDGRRAVELAERVARQAPGGAWQHARHLAAAYAEAGRYERAVSTLEDALRRARRAGDARFGDVVARELALYRSGRPFRLQRR